MLCGGAAALALALAAAPAHAVVGGTAVPQGKYPSVAHVVIGGTFACTGTLVAPSWVLTAGHCGSLTGGAGIATPLAFPPPAFGVTAGTVDPQGAGGERLTVERVVIPPQYLATSGFDTTLLQLSAPARTAPTPVAGTGFEALWRPGALETVAGFGTTSSGGEAASVLQEAKVPVVADDACGAAYSSFEAATQLCGGYAEGGRDTCQGDSGGPLLATAGDGRRYVVGATSYGDGCGRPGVPGVYARLADRTLGDFVRANAPEAVADASPGAVTTPAERYDPATKQVTVGSPPTPAPATGTTTPGFTSSLAVDRTTRHTFRVRGVRVRVRCSAACSAKIVLRVDGVSAKRLGLRSTTVATAGLSRSSAGRSTVRPRLGSKLAAAMRALPRARFTVRAAVRGPAGAPRVVVRAVQLAGR